jgi:hypothetical protein
MADLGRAVITDGHPLRFPAGWQDVTGAASGGTLVIVPATISPAGTSPRSPI